MRIVTTGQVARTDVAPLLELVDALHRVWGDQRFGPDGFAIDPLTGRSDHRLSLVRGRHRRRGARYGIVVETPVQEVLSPLAEELDRERAELLRGGASETRLEELEARRRAAAVTVRVDRSHVVFTLEDDERERLAGSLLGEGAAWTADIAVGGGRRPRLEASGTAVVARLLTGPGTGLARWLIGRRASGSIVVDAAASSTTGGTLVVGSGRIRRARVRLHVEVAPGAGRDAWEVEARFDVEGRGLGRLPLALGGGFLRRAWAKQEAETWRRVDAEARRVPGVVEELRREVAAAGSIDEVARRLVWAPDREGWVPGGSGA